MTNETTSAIDLVERVADAIEGSLDLSDGLKSDLRNDGEFEKAARAAIEVQSDTITRLQAALTTAESEARRFAEFYSVGSDGRNTLVMLADKIAAVGGE